MKKYLFILVSSFISICSFSQKSNTGIDWVLKNREGYYVMEEQHLMRLTGYRPQFIPSYPICVNDGNTHTSNDDISIAIDNEHNLYGYCKGFNYDIIVEPIFASCTTWGPWCVKGLCSVMDKNDKVGAICLDENSPNYLKLVVPCIYDKVVGDAYTLFENGSQTYIKDGKKVILHYNGEYIPNAKSVSAKIEGKPLRRVFEDYEFYPTKTNCNFFIFYDKILKKYGMTLGQQPIFCPGIFDKIYDRECKNYTYIVEQNGKLGVLSLGGYGFGMVAECKYDKIIINDKNGTLGVYDSTITLIKDGVSKTIKACDKLPNSQYLMWHGSWSY